MDRILIITITLITVLQVISPLCFNEDQNPFTKEISKDCSENDIEELSESEAEKICTKSHNLPFISERLIAPLVIVCILIPQYHKNLSYPPPEHI